MQKNLMEAATVRAKAKAAARALRDLLADKTLPAEMRKQVENLNQAMGKTWADLEGEAKLDPERESMRTPGLPTPVAEYGAIPFLKEGDELREAANMGAWLEAMLHYRLTEMADYAYAEGRLTRDERKAVSHAVGQGLDAFRLVLEADAPGLYGRGPWAEAVEGDVAVSAAVEHENHEKNERHEMVEGEFVPLVERSVRRDGTIPIKVIAPGWGSSGYYAADMLERSAGKFGAGTKMYWNHPTPSEERERPERDLRDLAAELVGDARWQAQGPAGAGLYAEAKVFEPYQKAVDELGPHIGVSIRALGKAVPGQAEGRTGKVIQEINQVASVDFVTQPGAGGQVLQIFEARRPSGAMAGSAGDFDQVQHHKEVDMDEEFKKLKEANAQLEVRVGEQATQIARMTEAMALREASDLVAGMLAKYPGLPSMTRTRLQAQLASNPPMKDGRPDVAALGEAVQAAVKDEMAYLAEAAGLGQVRGMGSGGSAAPMKAEDVEAELSRVFEGIGLSEAAAKQAAKGR